MKKVMCLILTVIVLAGCEKEEFKLTADLTIEFKYDPGWEHCTLKNAIHGRIYGSGLDVALTNSLYSDARGQIHIEDLNHGDYIFEYYVKPDCRTLWPIPIRRAFQITGGKDKFLRLY